MVRRIIEQVAVAGTVLAALVLVAPPASADQITVDLSGYPNGTSVAALSVPGVTFEESSPGLVTIDTETRDWPVLRITGANDPELSILVPGGTSVSLRYRGTGSCQMPGFDVITLYLDGSLVDTLTTFQPGYGRCVEDVAYLRVMAFDEIRFDSAVYSPGQEALLVDNLAFTTGATMPAGVPLWLQQHGRASTDSMCDSGWGPSWAQWPNGGTGGWVCSRSVPALG
jgi:hypothetical protein